ncbi:hypothetical protein [Streptomyces sp. NPDC017524]|uniref:hypothetical protein n=1 Tax=unclassified Streptomyces TaxID=2593676 RepID=UPI0037A6C5BE
MKKLKRLRKHLTMPLAAGALALAMVGVSAGAAQAATFTYPGAKISWSAGGEILTVKDTKTDGRYIYTMGQFAGTNVYLTPHCSTRGQSSKTCNYAVAERKKINFWVYSVRGSSMKKIGEFSVTA